MSDKTATCPDCNGRGEIEGPARKVYAGKGERGWIEPSSSYCETCYGTGVVMADDYDDAFTSGKQSDAERAAHHGCGGTVVAILIVLALLTALIQWSRWLIP